MLHVFDSNPKQSLSVIINGNYQEAAKQCLCWCFVDRKIHDCLAGNEITKTYIFANLVLYSHIVVQVQVQVQGDVHGSSFQLQKLK